MGPVGCREQWRPDVIWVALEQQSSEYVRDFQVIVKKCPGTVVIS